MKKFLIESGWIKASGVFLLLVLLFPQISISQDKKTTLAVIYFDNNVIMNNEKYDPLKKGFADMLISELAKINKFRLVERQRIQALLDEFALAEKPNLMEAATKTQLGKFLGAQLMLMGGFFMVDEDEFRVDARIIQTETGLTVSTCEITSEFKNLFKIVKEISKKVVEDLKIDLSSLEKKELGRSINGTGEELLKYSQALNIQDKARQEERFGSKDKAKQLYADAKKLYKEAFDLNQEYTMAKERIDEIDKVLKDMDSNVDRIAPQVVLAASGDGGRGLITSEPKQKVIGYASDMSGILEIKVNDVKATLQEANEKEGGYYNLKGKIVKFAAEIPLAVGDNPVNITATDILGNIGIQPFNLKRSGEKISESSETNETSGMEFKLPKIYAVIVGVSKYKNTQFNLNYADVDAKLFYDFLKSPNGGSLPDDQIKLVLNEEATRANITGVVQDVFKRTKKEDIIFFYFAGHGWAEGQDMYFLTNEVEMKNLIGTALWDKDIEHSVKVAHAKKAIMIFDACHAGATKISFGTARDIDVRSRLTLEMAQAADGIGIITAAQSNQQSKEDSRWGGGHGAFTWYFVEGLKGPADANNNKIITLQEAFDYVDQKVKEATEGNQRPDREGNLDIPISVIK